MKDQTPVTVGVTVLSARASVELAAVPLSEAERARGIAFRQDADRQRFLVGRWLLRTLTAQVLGISFDQVDLAVDPLGRPVLNSGLDSGEAGWFLSLAHSGEVVLAAIARTPVGVDVEELPTRPQHPRLAERVCSPEEFDRLSQLDEPARQVAFTEIWVRKEAYGKALGVGLGFPMRSVTVAPGSHIRGIAECFGVVDLDVGPGFAAALVVAGQLPAIELHTFG